MMGALQRLNNNIHQTRKTAHEKNNFKTLTLKPRIASSFRQLLLFKSRPTLIFTTYTIIVSCFKELNFDKNTSTLSHHVLKQRLKKIVQCMFTCVNWVKTFQAVFFCVSFYVVTLHFGLKNFNVYTRCNCLHLF